MTRLYFLLTGSLLLLSTHNRLAWGNQVGTIFSGPTTGDAASIYWNPGAMTLTDGTSSQAFGSLSAIRLHYERSTPSAFTHQPYPEASNFIPKPNFSVGVVTDATLRDFRFGLHIALPILEGATWDKEVDGRPSSTRYFAQRARFAVFKIEPAAAYRINRYISVGVGLDVEGVMLVHDVQVDFGAKIDQISCKKSDGNDCSLDAPIPRENPTFDAKASIDGFGWGIGVFGGVLITPFPWLRLGVGFHSGGGHISVPVDMAIDLPSSVTQYFKQNLPSIVLPPLQAKGEVEVTSPMTTTFGVAISPSWRWEIATDVHWMDMSAVSVMMGAVRQADKLNLIGDQVLIRERNDLFILGLRGAYWVLQNLAVAVRLEFETNTRPDRFTSPVSIDYDKLSLHLGLGWQVTSWFALVTEYGRYFLFDRDIHESFFSPHIDPTTPEEEGLDKPSPAGKYSGEVDRFGVGFRFNF